MRRVWIIGLCVGVLAVAAGVTLPMLARPSNCGGNSAALAACRNICLAIRIISLDRGTNVVDLSGLRPDELQQFQHIPGMTWLHGAHLLIRSSGLAPHAGETKSIMVVCDTPYSNVPQRLFGRAPATHAVGYSDGTVGLLSPADFHSIDLSDFKDIVALQTKSKVEPSDPGEARTSQTSPATGPGR